jgi:phosphate transport system substrate-binding protein
MIAKEWADKISKGTSVSWPAGFGGKENEGVAGIVKQTEGNLGCVELTYAVKNNLPAASLKDNAGNFATPTFDAVPAAAAGAVRNMPADLRVSITDAAGKNSYPTSGFTWLLIHKDMKDKTKAKAIADFLSWARTDGQSYAKNLYAYLPKEVVKMCEKKINSISLK